jgi:hypothetical protein
MYGQNRGALVRLAPGNPGYNWVPPSQRDLKINVDGAFNPAAVGVIVRDSGGNPQAMAWRLLIDCRDAELAEALACLEGIKLIHHWPNAIRVVVETDCATIVSKAQCDARDYSGTSAIIGDLKEAMAQHGDCRIQKVRREQNRIAHNLVKFALKSRSSSMSFSVVPFCIQDLVSPDRSRYRTSDVLS